MFILSVFHEITTFVQINAFHKLSSYFCFFFLKMHNKIPLGMKLGMYTGFIEKLGACLQLSMLTLLTTREPILIRPSHTLVYKTSGQILSPHHTVPDLFTTFLF